MSENRKLNTLADLANVKFDDLKPSFTSNITDQREIHQELECHFSKKGRAGKVATVIKGYIGNNNEIRELAKGLKKKLSVGGTVKNGQIIIQGNYREKIIGILSDMGFKLKRVGG
tara:strand:+ start:1045 stop:1389 length:345 start_codon:yes stop_codon:yes gene_type:complete